MLRLSSISLSLVVALLGACGSDDASVDAASMDAGDERDVAAADSGADAREVDAPALDGGALVCPEGSTFVPTASAVTALSAIGEPLLVGTREALELRDGELQLMDSETMAVLSLAADAGRGAVFDGSDARAFAFDDDGLEPGGLIDVSGHSVLALRETTLFAFRYALGARINTMEVNSLEDIALPSSLGSVRVEGRAPAGVAVQGEYAYALDVMDSVMSVIHIADPAAMEIVARFPVADIDDMSQVVVRGDTAYVGTTGGLLPVNIARPASPEARPMEAGGPLVTVRDSRLATASATSLHIFRVLPGGDLASVREEAPEATPTALTFSDSRFIYGAADGLRSSACAL